MAGQFHKPDRHMDQRIAVAPAGCDRHHPRRRVLGQPVGQHASGRAGADNHAICLHARPSPGCHCEERSGEAISSGLGAVRARLLRGACRWAALRADPWARDHTRRWDAAISPEPQPRSSPQSLRRSCLLLARGSVELAPLRAGWRAAPISADVQLASSRSISARRDTWAILQIAERP